MTTPEERLKELGINLPVIANPGANYMPYRRVGQMFYLSGQTPKASDGSPSTVDRSWAKAELLADRESLSGAIAGDADDEPKD